MGKNKSLARLRSDYHPKPSDQFYKKMQEIPWRKSRNSIHKKTLRTVNVGWRFALALILFLALFSLAIPSVRASVNAWLGLSIAPSNQMPVQAVTLVAATPSATEINPSTPPAEASVPPAAEREIPAGLQELSAQAGWEMLSPANLPEGYQYENAYLDTNHNAVFITYTAVKALSGASDPAMTQTETITFLQAQSNDFVPMQVAPSATLTDIEVNGQPGVYTIGAWDTEFVPDPNAPNGGSMLSTWRNDLAVKNLYWQVGNIFTLLVTSDEEVSQEALILMAESVGK
jgi:hypothetical protein